jgi:hypothetical protein
MSQVQATITRINNSPLPQEKVVAFPTDNLFVRENGTGSIITSEGSDYYCDSPVSTVISGKLIGASVVQVGSSRQPLPFQAGFPPSAAEIHADSTVSGANAFIKFSDKRYYVTSTVSELETAANAIGGGSGDPVIINALPLVYAATLTQSGTNAPVATVSANTIGAIAWTRGDVGAYRATLTGAFPAGKVVMFAGSLNAGARINFYRGTVDRLELETKNNALTEDDDWLFETPVLIQVYP